MTQQLTFQDKAMLHSLIYSEMARCVILQLDAKSQDAKEQYELIENYLKELNVKITCLEYK